MLGSAVSENSSRQVLQSALKDEGACWQEERRIELLYRHPFTSALGGSLGILFVATILFYSLRLDWIWYWMGIALSFQILWIPLYKYFEKSKDKLSIAHWKRLHGGLSVCTGLCLATLPVIIFPVAGMQERMIVMVTFAGFIAVAANTNASWPPSFALYGYPPAIATMVMMSLQMTAVTFGLAAMVAVFLIAMHRTNTQTNEMFNENLELAEALRYAASHDPLVGLANRTEFTERLNSIAKRSQLASQTVGIITIDLDNFKTLNDHFGHAEGDRALIAVGAAMRNATRGGDVVARLGGDEFAVVVFPCDARQANRVADKLLKEIRNLNFATNDSGQILGASLGVACSTADGFDPDTLLARSDKACYQAKHRGRNRVEYAAI